MRILQVVPYSYPYAGPAKVSYGISKELVERGHKVVMYTSDMENKYLRIGSQSEDVDGIRIQYFRTLGASVIRQLKLFITPEIVSTVKEEIKNFDIIHLHEYRTFQNIVIAHYAKKHGVPYVLQAHGSLSRIVAMQKLKWIYDALFGFRLLGDASKVIALSRMEVQQYRSMGLPEEKIVVIPNGIDLSEYANLLPKGAFKKKFGITEEEKIVLYVGRIHESKGLDLLAQAFKIVSETVSNVRLVVVGPDDGYAAEFSRLISDLRIEEKVLLTGFVEKEDKLAAFIDSNVFVTPLFSGSPVTFLEACLAGCPIVTTSNELDWIHDNVGYVVENSSITLAGTVSKLLLDEWTQERFKSNSRCTIKNFDISNVTCQLEKVYEEALSHTCC